MKYYIVKVSLTSVDAFVINSADNYVDAKDMVDEYNENGDTNTESFVYRILPAVAHSSAQVEQDKNNAL